MPGQTLALAAVSYVLSRCTHRPIGLFIIVDRQTTLVKVASVPVLAVHPEGAGPSWSPTHEYWRAVGELNLAGSGRGRAPTLVGVRACQTKGTLLWSDIRCRLRSTSQSVFRLVAVLLGSQRSFGTTRITSWAVGFQTARCTGSNALQRDHCYLPRRAVVGDRPRRPRQLNDRPFG